MDTIVVGAPEPERRQVHQQDGVGAAVADVAAGGQLGLLLGGQVVAAVGADQQPGACPGRRRAGRGSRPARRCGAARGPARPPPTMRRPPRATGPGRMRRRVAGDASGARRPVVAPAAGPLCAGRLGRGRRGAVAGPAVAAAVVLAAEVAARRAVASGARVRRWWGRGGPVQLARSGTARRRRGSAGRPDRGGSPARVPGGGGGWRRAGGTRVPRWRRRSSLTRTIYGSCSANRSPSQPRCPASSA